MGDGCTLGPAESTVWLVFATPLLPYRVDVNNWSCCLKQSVWCVLGSSHVTPFLDCSRSLAVSVRPAARSLASSRQSEVFIQMGREYTCIFRLPIPAIPSCQIIP